MYLWKIEYNAKHNNSTFISVVNCFKLCIFERLNTTQAHRIMLPWPLWIALNYVSLKDWIQLDINIKLYFNILQQISQLKFCIQFISPELKIPDFFSSIWFFLYKNYNRKIRLKIWILSIKSFISLFFRKKEKQKKLAAADKFAKILSSSLDKNCWLSTIVRFH